VEVIHSSKLSNGAPKLRLSKGWLTTSLHGKHYNSPIGVTRALQHSLLLCSPKLMASPPIGQMKCVGSKGSC